MPLDAHGTKKTHPFLQEASFGKWIHFWVPCQSHLPTAPFDLVWTMFVLRGPGPERQVPCEMGGMVVDFHTAGPTWMFNQLRSPWLQLVQLGLKLQLLTKLVEHPSPPVQLSMDSTGFEGSAIWLWVKNVVTPTWNFGKWKGLKPAVHGCCWETCYIFACCCVVGNPHLTSKF